MNWKQKSHNFLFLTFQFLLLDSRFLLCLTATHTLRMPLKTQLNVLKALFLRIKYALLLLQRKKLLAGLFQKKTPFSQS